MILVDDENKKITNSSKADIRVIGVGGGGGNAIETMIQAGIEGVRFISINTDAQALSTSSAKSTIQLGTQLTKGLGAGANPEIGRRAAMESYEEIVNQLQGADMVFVTAGMGGGTGTGGAPIVAEAARDLNILTVGVVTYPFLFEGHRRKKHAEAGIIELKKHVDTLIIIPNEKLLGLCEQDTPLLQTFKKADEVLLQAVKGIAELVSVQGLINLDFADVKTVMSNRGLALMSIGIAEGPDRAIQAISQAISSPLLGNLSIQGAQGMIVNIRAGSSLSLSEVSAATSSLTKVVDENAEIIIGAVIDESMGDRLSVTLIATGFNEFQKQDTDTQSLSSLLKQQSSSIEIKEPEQNLTSETVTVNEEISIQENANVGSVENSNNANAEKANAERVHNVNAGNVNYKFSEEELKNNRENLLAANDTVKESSKEESKTEILEAPEDGLTLKDKLLLKVKEYQNKQEQTSKPVSFDNQIDMDWKEDSSQEHSIDQETYSPFETNVDLSEEDLNN